MVTCWLRSKIQVRILAGINSNYTDYDTCSHLRVSQTICACVTLLIISWLFFFPLTFRPQLAFCGRRGYMQQQIIIFLTFSGPRTAERLLQTVICTAGWSRHTVVCTAGWSRHTVICTAAWSRHTVICTAGWSLWFCFLIEWVIWHVPKVLQWTQHVSMQHDVISGWNKVTSGFQIWIKMGLMTCSLKTLTIYVASLKAIWRFCLYGVTSGLDFDGMGFCVWLDMSQKSYNIYTKFRRDMTSFAVYMTSLPVLYFDGMRFCVWLDMSKSTYNVYTKFGRDMTPCAANITSLPVSMSPIRALYSCWQVCMSQFWKLV